MLVLVLVFVLVVGRGRYTRNRVGSGMGLDSTGVQWFDDGNDDGNDEVDGPQSQWVDNTQFDDGNDWVDGTAYWDFGKAGRNDRIARRSCGKADCTRDKIDGNDRIAWRNRGKADHTRKADCTRKAATAADAGGTVMASRNGEVCWQ